MYGLDVNDGGDCSLIRQFHLSNATTEDAPLRPSEIGSRPTPPSPTQVASDLSKMQTTDATDSGAETSEKPTDSKT